MYEKYLISVVDLKNWNIENVISEFSKWSNKFIENLSKDLKLSYPDAKGYSIRNLKYMKKFAERFNNFEIVQEVLAQINWYDCRCYINVYNI